MKQLALIAIVLLGHALAFSQSEEAPIDYPIRDLDVNGDQLARVHKSVLASIAREHERAIQESSLNVRIIQLVPDRGYLCSADDRIVLIETTSKQYADGDEISVCVEATGEFFEYTTVLGAASRVHVLRPLGEPFLPDLGEFYDLVKGGKTFLIIEGFRTIKCRNCGGFGKGSMMDGRYVPCRGCDDQGTWKKPNFYRIVW
jgi:hypothetical protein